MFVIRDLYKLRRASKSLAKLSQNLLNEVKIYLSLNRERTYEKFDFEVNAKYYDNGSIVGNTSNTIVAIHGTPGDANNFGALFRTMTEKGVRVIIPEMPGKTWLLL